MSTMASRISQAVFQQLDDLHYLFRTLFFALRCAWKTDRRSWVICHDTTTSLPALWAARNTNKIIYDISETPALRGRTTDRFRQPYSLLPNLMECFSNYVLRRAPFVMCSSSGFAALARERTDGQVVVSLSYDETGPAKRARRAGSEDTDIRHIAWPSTFLKVTGAELALDIVESWPETWKLIIIGEMDPDSEFNDRVLALGDRIHITGSLNRADYLAEVAACDAALILFETELENTRLCVPNRLYDCMAAGTPFVSTPHPSISQMVKNLPTTGEICETRCPSAFIAPLNRVSERPRTLPPTKEQVTTALDGLSMQAAFAKFLPPAGGDNQIVTILANRRITGRHRIATMTDALHALGYKTRVFAQS